VERSDRCGVSGRQSTETSVWKSRAARRRHEPPRPAGATGGGEKRFRSGFEPGLFARRRERTCTTDQEFEETSCGGVGRRRRRAPVGARARDVSRRALRSGEEGASDSERLSGKPKPGEEDDDDVDHANGDEDDWDEEDDYQQGGNFDDDDGYDDDFQDDGEGGDAFF
jgi:hypothetical protein